MNNNKMCSLTQRNLCSDMNCKVCENRSFASHPKSKYWSNLNNISARQVFICSGNKYIFKCDCNHFFDAALNNINKGHWCPFCNNKKLCDDLECIKCEEKSFMSNPKSQYWSKLNDISPRDVFKNSIKKFHFDCPDCNCIYTAQLNNITTGYWCDCLHNKSEAKLCNYLLKNYINIEKQKRFKWCKNKIYLPFDFCIEEYKLIIELDGNQHFKQISNWQSPEFTQERDKYKNECAINNGYSIIRIYQVDVWNDKNDWKNKLQNAVKQYDEPTIIYIGDIYTIKS